MMKSKNNLSGKIIGNSLTKNNALRNFMAVLCTAIVCVVGICINTLSVSATSGNLKGNKILRPGDTLTVELHITDAGKYALEGTLEYDSSLLTFVSITPKMNDWVAEANDNFIIAYDDALSTPINKSSLVLTIDFKLTPKATEGTSISVAIKNILVSDGENESNISAVTYTNTVSRPLSSDATLSSLLITNANLNPPFASKVTTYNVGEVDFAVNKLDIKAATTDANAKVSVSGNSLTVGANKVVITVTAENGSKKEYVINVTRKQDPNYVASSDASISNITVNTGILSPIFNKDITDYVIYLPYEKKDTTITFSATPSDDKAPKIDNVVTNPLTEGENKIIITCKAEDGSTKEYSVIVYVMPQYEGTLPDISNGVEETTTKQDDIETEVPTTKEHITITAPDATKESGDFNTGANANSDNGINTVLFGVVVLESIAIAVLVYLSLKNKKNTDK